MKIVCDALDLTEALSKVIKAIPAKVTIGVNNEGVKITAAGDYVTLTANDMDMEITKTIKASVMQDGEVIVPGKYLYEIVKRVESNSQVDIYSIEEDIIHIRHLDNEATLSKFRVEEYMPLDNGEASYDISFALPQKDLKTLIDKTSFAAATDDSRPVFKGCLFDIKGNKMSLVALDGYRMSLSEYELPASLGDFKAIVPVKSLNEISRLLDGDEDKATVYIGSKRVAVDIGHTKVTANLISGNFLDYSKTIPSSFETTVTVNNRQLLDSLERATVLTKYDKSNIVKIEVKEGKMTINASSSIGEIRDVIKIFTKGKDISLALNSRFIIDVLKNCDGEFINISFNSPTTPFILEPVSEEDVNKYLYLLLPIRV